ncbi:hypothetical protein [Halobacillus naozhouensis]|uniref:Uncharacterized protein n=1 Tax=Halobacillus naozhouensis TaxID=554880 RepID=A0ABY8J0U7_9BACI|nr:hypothetical protein [Halobacillus naozhouensis]WFT75691.1 hypothetical protein P9989_04695 [Halobacillus naozhouensis]
MSFKVVAFYNEKTEINFLQSSLLDYRTELHFNTNEEAEAFICYIKNNEFSHENYRFKIMPYKHHLLIDEGGKHREKNMEASSLF